MRSAQQPLVLLVDDDAPTRKFVRTVLRGAGYQVAEAPDGAQGLVAAATVALALVILDLGLPDIDGQAVLRKMRESLQVPIIILSARNEPEEKIKALDNGADDYLQKPFSTGELLARIRLALRHAAMADHNSTSDEIGFGDVRVDMLARRVFVRDQEIHLTPIEYKLLTLLLRNAGRVLNYQFLLREAWSPKEVHDPQHVRVFIAGLRRKIEANPARPCHLLTEQGVGYRLVV